MIGSPGAMEPGREVVAVGDLSEGRVGWVGGGGMRMRRSLEAG